MGFSARTKRFWKLVLSAVLPMLTLWVATARAQLPKTDDLQVAVMLEQPGDDQQIATATTSVEGRLEVHANPAAGRYYAQLEQSLEPVGFCAAATSKVVKVR